MYQVLYCPQTIHLSPIFIDYEQASLIIDYKGETICDIRETSKVTLWSPVLRWKKEKGVFR